MSNYAYSPPPLKNSVDMQLQSAFSDGNWPTVVRLASKRFATFKDPYYEAIKICAESQLDGTAEKCAALVAIDELVKSKKTPDIDALELYEFACRDFLGYEVEYADGLGPLRARWVKANATSPLAVQCLQSCLMYWDLVSAQQIATTLDKTFANSPDRRYMFWSITLTFLLSISPQCTEASRKIYSMLTVRQLEKAADLTESSEKLEKTARGLLTEEEVCLYYKVLLSHGTKEEFLTRLQSPKLGAIAQLRQSRKLLFCEALDVLEKWGKWDHIYNLCREALNLGLEEVTTPFLVCDLRIWKKFASSASKATDNDAALAEVQKTLNKFIELKDKATPMYKKNISLALLETTFKLPSTTLNPNHDQSGLSPRVVQIGLYLDQYYERLAAFDDIKGYVADLSFEEIKSFMDDVLPKIPGENPENKNEIIIKAMECKLRYLLTTCPQTLSPQSSVIDGESQRKPYKCRFCSRPASSPCEFCLKKIVSDAADTYSKITADKELLAAIPGLDRDPRLDLAVAMGTALLKLAGLRPYSSDATHSLWEVIQPSLLFQAVLLLDNQLQITPNDNGLRLLLIQLYLLLGCASYAYQLWVPMGVKRTIQDALSPLFFDRISTIAPGLFQGTRPLMEPLRTYYSYTLQNPSPLRIWDAFSSGSYTSILDMTEYDKTLRTSCTLMMTLVEERRATRSFGGKIDIDIDDHPLTADIFDDTVLVNKTDYGSFPNLESVYGAPIQEYLRLGPGLSNERSHLHYYTEKYLDLLTYKVPQPYKPAKPADAAAREKAYTLEVLSHVSETLTTLLQSSQSIPLTPAEHTYFSILSLLSSAVSIALSTPRTDSHPPETLSLLTTSIKSAAGTLRTGFSTTSTEKIIGSLTELHSTALARDTGIAIKQSAAFVLAWNEKENARDRSGRSGLHKEVISEMKALEAAGVKVVGEVKAHFGKLKEGLSESGWLDRVLEVTFPEDGEDEAVRRVVKGGEEEEWAGRVVDSWRESVKGWVSVNWQ
ncbi:N-acetyltransferase B complex non catalytic subunit-domain-containing protein [Podospora fimiseda]|uniref:N-acetyltransferase B complex non catalytic subunit-domain-containing protein n=1 Tax=Podospora fimiseda TaxID=252190 RepID=A0AAN7H1M2_9PEZI|nr:N-acetyltransferase B complex non catalytic subunit-domain-containing protein [Podospora fimiseda]